MSEPASIPMWQTVVGVLGLGSLIATGLSHWLALRSDRKKWINDNKKLEWRQLIDELGECLETMSYAFDEKFRTDDSIEPMTGIIQGNRIIKSNATQINRTAYQ
jgi:hypothetical protein